MYFYHAEIPLPSTQYQLEVKDSKICSLDGPHSQVFGEALGDTEVVLRDKSKFQFQSQEQFIKYQISFGNLFNIAFF